MMHRRGRWYRRVGRGRSDHTHSPRVVPLVLAIAFLTSACVTATTNITPRIEMAVEDRSVVVGDDAVVIFPEDGARCVRKSLHQRLPDLRIVSPDEFQRVAFPDEPMDRTDFTYPIPERQRAQLSTEVFRERVTPVRLRHLVSVGEIEGSRGGSERICGTGVCGDTWVNTLRLVASVVDLKDAREVGRVAVTAAGSRTIFVMFPILWFGVERTQKPACQALGEMLADFLSGRFPYSSQRAPQPGH